MYVLDTNVIIHRLRKEANVLKNFNDAVISGHNLVIPRAVDYEICRGFGLLSAPRKEAMYEELTASDGCCKIVDMEESIWNRSKLIYIELYKKGFTVGEIDIIIAAFCLNHDYTLVTANTKDFENISGLKLVDWTQLSV